MIISKTDYILYRECPKNAWYKIHEPGIYYESELSSFEKHIIETGNEVEEVARKIFSDGVMIEGRGEEAQKLTQEYLDRKVPTIFQPVFVWKDACPTGSTASTDCGRGFMAAVDILKYDEDTESYRIYEIKASNEIDKKHHLYDLAFQVVLLRKCGLKLDVINLMHLNPEYVRSGELDIIKLFQSEDVSHEVNELCEEVALEMDSALDYLSQSKEPKGACVCIYKGRSNHCTTFSHSNPLVPKYGVHDITRIGLSKKKLAELIDSEIFQMHEVPEDMELSLAQRNQISAHVMDEVIMNKGKIADELENLKYPLYFIDYETFPSAIPMFDGFSPYQQIPFQYALYVQEKPGAEMKFYEFLHDTNSDPSRAFAESMQKHIGNPRTQRTEQSSYDGDTGSVIVWSKKFECSRNKEIAERLPEFAPFMESVNNRTYDLMDVFTKQHYVHKDFKGSTSIKKVLPVLAPELSYKELAIQEGGTASSSWMKLIGNDPSARSGQGLSATEKSQLKKDMLEYCKMDSYAMVRILEELEKVLEK